MNIGHFARLTRSSQHCANRLLVGKANSLVAMGASTLIIVVLEWTMVMMGVMIKNSNQIAANGSGIGDARIVETLYYKQAVQRVLPIPC